MALRPLILAAALILVGGEALAQAKEKPPEKQADAKTDAPSGGMRQKAGEIVTQPVRDVGVGNPDIPPVLAEAVKDPYSLKGVKTCRQLSAALTALNEALGPDFEPGEAAKENRAGKLAEAGGKTVINSLIPFRQLVREISGAAPAQRSLNAAVDAGLARRGFLRGVHLRQGCKTRF